MKIDTSAIRLSAKRRFFQQEEFSVRHENKFADLFAHQLRSAGSMKAFLNTLRLPDGIRLQPVSVGGRDAIRLSDAFTAELEKLRQILKAILERFNTTQFNGCRVCPENIRMLHILKFNTPAIQVFEYEKILTTQYDFKETESTQFFADGTVKTADGRTIDLSFRMDLDREYFKKDQFVKKETGYMMIDPLVINLGTTVPKISDVRIDFDLDADGGMENIPLLESGSGFLSLDRNQDGVINDGSELFGPSTGDGFGELGEYDLDHNLWIDENDPVFDELTLWGADGEGQMQLTRVKDAGIGAIYLPHVDSSFDFKDQDNNLEARLKKSSIALNEDGTVSSIQEMDWTA